MCKKLLTPEMKQSGFNQHGPIEGWQWHTLPWQNRPEPVRHTACWIEGNSVERICHSSRFKKHDHHCTLPTQTEQNPPRQTQRYYSTTCTALQPVHFNPDAGVTVTGEFSACCNQPSNQCCTRSSLYSALLLRLLSEGSSPPAFSGVSCVPWCSAWGKRNKHVKHSRGDEWPCKHVRS